MDAYPAAFAILHDAGFVTREGDFRSYETEGLNLRLLSE